jgi:hypothetical protein
MKTTITLIALLGIMATTAQAEAPKQRQAVTEEMSEVSSFCRDRLSVLKSAYRRAELESQAGNTASSMGILEQGLRDASLRIQPRFANALTAKAIRRGITLLENLKATSNNRQKVRAINNFLFNYYVFIEDVSGRLDIPYFSSNSGFSRILNSNTQFERLFISFAKEQVNMVLKTMTTTDFDGRSEVIYPIGSPTLVLTALKVTTLAMANDLSDSIFAARYACTIEALDNVSNDIARYLTEAGTYSDEFIAVQELVGAAQRAVNGARECKGGSSRESQANSRTVDALHGAIRLESGTTQQVLLNGGQYIKKLIISAEGLRNDAMFDVVVNGDVKGTVYVPGRDPSYFVTIEDSADSIELVSRGGTAIISRILVITE